LPKRTSRHYAEALRAAEAADVAAELDALTEEGQAVCGNVTELDNLCASSRTTGRNRTSRQTICARL